MRVLVLNGSPKSEASNTLILTTAFLEGLRKKYRSEDDIEIADIAKANIQPCKGCYVCWTSTPGKCCISDDMQSLSGGEAGLFQKSMEAELLIWSFPLYCYGMPSQIKAFMDRRLPAALPYIHEREDGGSGHPKRFDISCQKHVLISTGGLATIENNFDALIKQFDISFKDNYEKILCPQGELFRVPQVKGRTDDYLDLVRQAGAEYAVQGQIPAEIKAQLAEPLFSKDAYIEMANVNWEISETADPKNSAEQPGSLQISAAERLLRQMSSIYSPSPNAPKEEKTIEFFFTDTNEIYQLQVKENKSFFKKDAAEFKPYSIKIETPFEVWQNISNGEIDGKQALFQNKYRVLGEFDLMMSLMDGYSVQSKNPQSSKNRNNKLPEKSSMLVLLLPFLTLWILLPIFKNDFGAYTAIFISSCIPFFARIFRLSPYDFVSAFICNVLSIAFLAGVSLPVIVTLSYFLFGSMWLSSLFLRIPLCAWYSAGSYNGDEAFDNPLFILTNRIIAAFWGILYLFVCVFTWFVMQSAYASFIGLINSVIPALAGIATAVFVKWYPAYHARKHAHA